MSDDPRIGVRDEDLTPDERASWSDDRARRPDLAAAHAGALALGAAIRALPDLPAAASRRAPVGRWIGLAALTTVVLLAAAPWAPAPPLRARGGGATTGAALRLRAVAEGPRGPRVVDSGDTLAADERVVFEVEAARPGTVTVDEVGASSTRVWPTTGGWHVDAGRALVGGQQPAAWRSDGAGPRVYVAEWCDAAGSCVRDELTLTWSAR